MRDTFAEICDVIFNGRASANREQKPPTVTIDEIIRRKISYVNFGGKLYKVEAKEMELSK